MLAWKLIRYNKKATELHPLLMVNCLSAMLLQCRAKLVLPRCSCVRKHSTSELILKSIFWDKGEAKNLLPESIVSILFYWIILSSKFVFDNDINHCPSLNRDTLLIYMNLYAPLHVGIPHISFLWIDIIPNVYTYRNLTLTSSILILIRCQDKNCGPLK